MLSDNREQLVGIAVQGVIASPELPPLPASPYQVASDGRPYLLPAPGGIVYNVRMGDRALGWLADMVQPGVSIRNPQDGANQALKTLACVGNVAKVTSGAQMGASGVVVGKSGRFAEHVIVHFPRDVIEKLALGDRVTVRALGRSLALRDKPLIQLKSVSPELLDALEIEDGGRGRVRVRVRAIVPCHLTGAGAGLGSESGSVQVQTEDLGALSDHGLTDLRLGDLVAISDYDCRWGNGYLRGAMTVGVVSHGDSPRSGYGPGITPLIAAGDDSLSVHVVESRNVVDLLHLAA
ncbi:MAG: DUF4438 domain-containing protein [Candidatus Dormibacteraeota bacterium]|nr:DUF4438 domain-containing protein [Candidatus Dormibacteraeota bacterium]